MPRSSVSILSTISARLLSSNSLVIFPFLNCSYKSNRFLFRTAISFSVSFFDFIFSFEYSDLYSFALSSITSNCFLSTVVTTSLSSASAIHSSTHSSDMCEFLIQHTTLFSFDLLRCITYPHPPHRKIQALLFFDRLENFLCSIFE